MEKVHGGARKSSHSKGAGGAGREAGVSPPRLCRATGWKSGRWNSSAALVPTPDAGKSLREVSMRVPFRRAQRPGMSC